MQYLSFNYPVSGTRLSSWGFTLLELLLVILIIGISLSIALPSFYPLLQSYRLSHTLNAIERGLREARQESVGINQTVVMCPSADGLSCSTDRNWSNGFITFVDADKDGQRQSSETTIDTYIITRPVTVSFNRTRAVSFNGLGRAGSNGTFTICDPQERVHSWRLTVTHSGRMRRSSAPSNCA